MADDDPPPLLKKDGVAPLYKLEQFPALSKPSAGNLILRQPLKPTSFLEALKGKSTCQQSFDYAQIQHTPSEFDPSKVKTPAEFEGQPAIFFNVSEKSDLVSKLTFALIGKFSHGRPSWSNIQSFFQRLKLSGPHNASVLDHKHIIIECSNKEDFNRIWMKLAWSIDGYVMRVFKWGPEFNSVYESPIAPVWIRLEGLPLYLFDEMSLWNISNAIGNPLRIDPRNLNRSMLNAARVCVEIDVSKPLREHIKVGILDDTSGVLVESFSVHVFYDMVPHFCKSCRHIGHKQEQCKRSIDLPPSNYETGECSVTIQASQKAADIIPSKLAQDIGRPSVRQVCSSNVAQAKQVWKPMTIKRTATHVGVLEQPKTDKGNRFVTLVIPGNETSNGSQRDISVSEDLELMEQGNLFDQNKQLQQVPQIERVLVEGQEKQYTHFEVTGEICLKNDRPNNGVLEHLKTDKQVEQVPQVDSKHIDTIEGKSTVQMRTQNIATSDYALVERKDTQNDQVDAGQNAFCGAAAKDAQGQNTLEDINKEDLQQIVDGPNYSMVSAQAVHAAGQIAIGGEDAVCAAYAVVASAQDGQIADAASQFVQQQITVINGTTLQGADQTIVGQNADIEGAASQAATQAAKDSGQLSSGQIAAQSTATLVQSAQAAKQSVQLARVEADQHAIPLNLESSTSFANHKLQQPEVQNRFDGLLLEDSDVAAPFVDTAAADNKAIVLAILPVLAEVPNNEGQSFQAEETGTHQGQKEVPAVSSIVQERKVPTYHTSSSTWADQAETEDETADEQEREPQYNGLAFKLQEGDKDIHTAEKVRYIDFKKIDVFDDIIAPSKPGSVPSSPRSKFSRRAPALDDLALIHSKDELEFSSIHKVDEYPDDWWADNMEMEPTSSFRNRYNFRVRKSSRKGFKYRG